MFVDSNFITQPPVFPALQIPGGQAPQIGLEIGLYGPGYTHFNVDNSIALGKVKFEA